MAVSCFFASIAGKEGKAGMCCYSASKAEVIGLVKSAGKEVAETGINFSAAVAPGVQAVLVWDGAGYHTSGRLQVPANVSLIQLPSYSPELNPIENLWHYLRSHYWSNRKYADYAALEAAAIHAWRKACLEPNIIRSVCRVEYLERALNS